MCLFFLLLGQFLRLWLRLGRCPLSLCLCGHAGYLQVSAAGGPLGEGGLVLLLLDRTPGITAFFILLLLLLLGCLLFFVR